jgi:uncharacterized protein (DUF2249 family)
MSQVDLDLRDLPPPEPMHRILEALEQLPPGGCLFALTPLYPAPLLSLLLADGYAFRVCPLARGYRLAICHAQDAALLEALDLPTRQ